MTLYQDCSSHDDLLKNIAVRGWGLFSLYIYIENFKSLLVRNHWTDFNIMWQKCFFAKIVQATMSYQKTWPSGGRAYFPYIYIENLYSFI